MLHQGKNLTSECHEDAIRRATPKALLSPEEQSKVIEEKEAKGKGKGKADIKGSKEIDKTDSKVISTPPSPPPPPNGSVMSVIIRIRQRRSEPFI